MLFRLFLLFTLIPLVELILLVWIALQTNWMVTLAMIFLPGLLGAWLARREGLRCLREVRRQVLQGELPSGTLLEGLLILVAGALLITPGVLTDLAGFALLIPPVRRRVGRWLTERLRARAVTVVSTPWPGSEHHDKIIDVRVIDPNQPPKEDAEA
jgi:UPF0716 protein FxsA